MSMMVKFRELLNPLILNDEWVGFMGDSEYTNNDGELMMGSWSFLDIIKGTSRDNLNLDDRIDDSELFNGECLFEVENDNGVLCLVKFNYSY